VTAMPCQGVIRSLICALFMLLIHSFFLPFSSGVFFFSLLRRCTFLENFRLLLHFGFDISPLLFFSLLLDPQTQAAAELRHPQALFNLGLLYHLGLGVPHVSSSSSSSSFSSSSSSLIFFSSASPCSVFKLWKPYCHASIHSYA